MLVTRLSYSQIFLLGSEFALVASHLWAEQPNAWRTVIPTRLDSAMRDLGQMEDGFSLKFWDYALRRLEEDPLPSVNQVEFTTLFERLAVDRAPPPQHHTIDIASTEIHPDLAPATDESQKANNMPSAVHDDKLTIVPQKEYTAEQIEYPGVIRACQLYFNKVYSGKLQIPASEQEGMAWVSHRWDRLKNSVHYLTLSHTIFKYGRRLNREELSRFVKFCARIPDWMSYYRGLESRVNRMAMRVHYMSYLLSSIVVNEFEVDNIFKDLESRLGKLTDLGSEDVQKVWAQEWLKITQNHFLTAFASQPKTNVLSDESSVMVFKDFRLTANQDQLRRLRHQIFEVILGEKPTGRVSDCMARLESFGHDFLPTFRAAVKHQQSLPSPVPQRVRFLGAISGKFDWRLDSLMRNPSTASRATQTDEIQPAVQVNDIQA